MSPGNTISPASALPPKMGRRILLIALTLLPLQAYAQPVIYLCNIFTQLPGAPESPIFRFEVEGDRAILTYTFRARPTEQPLDFKLPLDVLNDSERSLVLGALTEGDEQHSPRYDVWVLDKKNMLLSSEVTRATDANPGRMEQRTGTCIIEN
jgi:hypothetical protein